MSYYATVVIPTFNGEKYLKEILTILFKQEVDYKYEVLIIDSGSTDKTLDIVRKFQSKHSNLRLHQIPNSEFGHGKTRQLAARLAKGKYVAYLSHDATPANKKWLYEMLKPFEFNDKIVAVMGQQIPRPHCIPLLKYEILATFSNFGPEFGTTVFYKDDFITDRAVFDAVRFYSDVNSATRRDFLLNKIPYRDVAYAEDQLFGEDVINAGYWKAYAPRGAVVHSNDLKLSEYRRRLFDETIGLRKSGVTIPVLSKRHMILVAAKKIVGDSIRIIKDRSYSFSRKIYWLLVNPLYNIEKWRGIYAATHVKLDDHSTIAKHSLEASRKSS